jgi:hypothetical protein
MIRRIRTFWVKHTVAILALICVQIASSIPAQAGNVVFSALSGPCSFYQSSIVYGQRYIAGYSGIITAINVLENSSAQTSYSGNFAASKYVVMADNGALAPVTIIDTFTADTLTSTNARYVGAASVTAGQKFWVIPSQAFLTFPACYFYPGTLPSANVISTGDWRLDTATTSSWSYINGSSPYQLNPPGTAGHLFAISLEVGNPTPVSISLGLQGGGNSAIYRNLKVVQATLSVDTKVTFYQSGKLIPGCKNIQSSALVASCNWKPNIHGAISLTASALAPNSSYGKGNAIALNVGVVGRTGTR